MASVYDLKPKFQKFLRPSILWLHKCGVTPNQVTVAAFVGSVAAGGLASQAADHRAWLLVLPAWLFLRMALNAIDGVLARDFDLKTVRGAILNELGDVLSDIALYLPLLNVCRQAQWAVLFFVIGAILTEFCGVLGQALGGKRYYQGPMGKSDRAFLVGALALVSYFFPVVMEYWAWIFGMAFAGTLVTCLNRLLSTIKELQNG